MLAMDRRTLGAMRSHPCATIRQGVLLFACPPISSAYSSGCPTLPARETAAQAQRGWLASSSDRYHRRRR
jgi:hypothetical protein